MRPNLTLLLALLVVTTVTSCKKDKTVIDCFPATPTVRELANQEATVKFTGTQYYIVEKGAIDTKLVPCNLLLEFQSNNLQVKVSGMVKSTASDGSVPCCTQNFVITQITK